jgi:hypothetical protein
VSRSIGSAAPRRTDYFLGPLLFGILHSLLVCLRQEQLSILKSFSARRRCERSEVAFGQNICDGVAMKIDIDRLTESELVELNHCIVARLNLLSQMRAHKEMLEFKIGNRVTF